MSLVRTLLGASKFTTHRRFLPDSLLVTFAWLAPRWFTIYLVFVYPAYLRHLNVGRKAIIKSMLKKQRCTSTKRDDFSEAWLITVQPHMREKTMLKTLGPKITQGFTMTLSESGQAMFAEKGIPLRHIHHDWVAAWLLIAAQYEPHKLFILSGLSDLWFMPLKLHMFKTHIAFDSYDPMGEYHKNGIMRLLNHLNYKLGKLYIIRDARFKDALRASKNWDADICYMPDATQFDMIDPQALKQKFASTDKIIFVSAGWVTSGDDGGILRSFQLIRKLWPNSEIHLCLTQFMRAEDPLFAPLVEYMNANEGCYVHHNLQADAYKTMLDKAHVGLNLHDPNVFGEPYKEFSMPMVRRSPSARTLDFAARGCILMTTKEPRYSQHMFKQYSPHQGVVHLTQHTKPEVLTSLIQKIREQAR